MQRSWPAGGCYSTHTQSIGTLVSRVDPAVPTFPDLSFLSVGVYLD